MYQVLFSSKLLAFWAVFNLNWRRPEISSGIGPKSAQTVSRRAPREDILARAKMSSHYGGLHVPHPPSGGGGVAESP